MHSCTMPGTALKKEGALMLLDAGFVLGLLVLASLSFYLGAMDLLSKQQPVPADDVANVDIAPEAPTAPLPYFILDSLSEYDPCCCAGFQTRCIHTLSHQSCIK